MCMCTSSCVPDVQEPKGARRHWVHWNWTWELRAAVS